MSPALRSATARLTEDDVTRSLDEVANRRLGTVDDAVRRVRDCAVAARRLQLPALAAQARYLEARLTAERGEPQAALRLVALARRGWLRAGDDLAAQRTELGRMQILDDLGRHAEAVRVGRALLAALDRMPEVPDDPAVCTWIRAAGHENLGVAHAMLGHYQQALHEYEQAEPLYRAVGRDADAARLLANRGETLREIGHTRESAEVFARALVGFRTIGDRIWTAKCMGDLARTHQLLGNLVEALGLLDEARAILDELGAGAEAIRIRLALADANLTVGLFGEARQAAEEAAERAAAAGMVPEHATAAFLAAQSDLARGDVTTAASTLEQAAGLFGEVGNELYGARVALAQADVHAARGDLARARAMAGTAIAALEAGDCRVPLASALLRLAELVTDDAAEGYVARAGQLSDELQLPQLRHGHRLQAARLLRAGGRADAAEHSLRLAVREIEHLGGALPDQALRIAFRADRVTAYDELVDLLVSRGGDDDVIRACRVSDTAKAQTLVDLMTGTVGRSTPRSDDSELDAARQELSAAYGELTVTDDRGRAAALRRRVVKLENDMAAMRRRLAVRDGRPGAARLSEVGGPMLPDQPAIAFHVIGDDIIGFAALPGGLLVRRLARARLAVDSDLDLLTAQWARFGIGAAFTRRHHARLVDTTRDILQSLYRTLLRPFGPELAAVGGGLVVVPHRRLHQVPFHALHDGDHYLLEQTALTVSTSMTRDGAARAAVVADGPPLLLAVPDENAPEVGAEVAAIAADRPQARVLRDAAATSAALRASLPGPGVVHLACHGLFRPDNPLFSALRLTDRWMTSAEVLELDLAGALVTLSACESGRAPGEAAEPIGLAWAFLAAGARAAVVSQWVLQDDVAAQMMPRFYRALADGQDTASAIRTAQLATARDHPHPFHWAPFTHITAPHVPSPGPQRTRSFEESR